MMTDEYCRLQSEILAPMPVEFHEALITLAWESGHAFGYEEVLAHLRNLVDNIAPAAAKLIDRVQQTCSVR